MNKLKQVTQKQGVGTLSLILGLLFALLATFNLINSIADNLSVYKIIYLSIPFYILSVICIIYRGYHSLSIVFLAVAVYCSAYNDNIDDYSGAIFYIFSFHMMNKKKYSIVILVLTLLSLSINASIFTFKFNTVINLLIAYYSIYIIYFFIIYRQIEKLKNKIKELENKLLEKFQREPIIRNIDVINITEEDKAIIKLYCLGYDYDKISRTLGLNVVPNTVRRKITAIKNQYKLKNDAHFGQWLFKRV